MVYLHGLFCKIHSNLLLSVMSNTAFKKKDAFFSFSVSPGNAEAPVS